MFEWIRNVSWVLVYRVKKLMLPYFNLLEQKYLSTYIYLSRSRGSYRCIRNLQGSTSLAAFMRDVRNAEVSQHRKGKMAARRCSFVLLSISILSLITVSDSQETTVPVGQYASASVNPQTVTEPAQQKAERRWEETEVGSTAAGDAATEKLDNLSHQTVFPSSITKPKDDFREELVIRPLHSGDIYASFQFRTLWKTDFRENKGKLNVWFEVKDIMPRLMCKYFPVKPIFSLPIEALF